LIFNFIKNIIPFLFFSKNKQPANYIPTFGHEKLRSYFDTYDLNELRKKRLFEIKMSQIMKEIFIYLLFLIILYVVAFSNLSSSSFQYNQLFLNKFVNKQKGEKMGLNEVNFNIDLDLFLIIITLKISKFKDFKCGRFLVMGNI
jgi:hypothetical protein